MNGIEKITERIAADNAAEVTSLVERAEKQADNIYNGYVAAADAEYDETVARGKKDAADRVVRLGGVAQLEAKKLQLAAKQEMLDRAFERASEKLLAMRDDDAAYTALLTRLALSGITKGTEALIFSDKERARFGKKVVIAVNEALEAEDKTASVIMSEESRAFEGGLYVQDGKVETNCTFAALLRLQRENMALEAAEILFT